MPISIPAFDQYQAPLVPLRGLWNAAPPEGDRYISAEIDWLVTTKSQAVQFSCSGNSPVALSQIVALGVDNSRSGSDVSFIFADSGFVLTVPAHNQLVAPVFTQGLMFYVSAPVAVAGDVVAFQVFNSMPPPVPIAPTQAQNHVSIVGAPVATNGNTQIVPAGVSGTLNSIVLTGTLSAGAPAGSAQFALIDGTGKAVWIGSATCPASTVQPYDKTVPSLNVRFTNGLVFNVSGSTLNGGGMDCNVYYSSP